MPSADRPETAPDIAQRGAALIAAIAERADREAFSALFLLFAPRVKAYLARTGSSPAFAEEVAQEAMLNVWRKARSFDPARANAVTWIFVIARNCRIDALRKERTALAYDLPEPDPADPTPTADAALVDSERERALQAAFDALSGQQKEVVQLSFYQDKPHAEIARELGLPLGTVKSRLRLAFKHLRARLEGST